MGRERRVAPFRTCAAGSRRSFSRQPPRSSQTRPDKSKGFPCQRFSRGDKQLDTHRLQSTRVNARVPGRGATRRTSPAHHIAYMRLVSPLSPSIHTTMYLDGPNMVLVAWHAKVRFTPSPPSKRGEKSGTGACGVGWTLVDAVPREHPVGNGACTGVDRHV